MMLEAINLTKFYGAKPAIEGISFTIGKGEVVGFLGANGAGKSTTMRILTGFIAPTFGQVKVAGMDPRHAPTREKFGYLPEDNPLPQNMRVNEYLRFRAGIKGIIRTNAVIEETASRCQIDSFLHQMIGRLSKGMRQRVGLADALLAKPEILILDEPTAGLDPRQAAETRELIACIGKVTTVFLSSHILHDIERICRRVIILDQGKLIADGDLRNICERNVEERNIVVGLATDDPVRETLRSIPGVRAVAVTNRSDDIHAVQVRITTPSGVDLRREISLTAANRGWIVTEMRMEPVTLDDIFRRLTR